MVALTIFIKQKLYVDRNFDCVTDMENFWKHVVLECAKLRHVDVPELARSVKYNVFKTICPKIWRGKGKWSTVQAVAMQVNALLRFLTVTVRFHPSILR